jgi:hypothetical protein
MQARDWTGLFQAQRDRREGAIPQFLDKGIRVADGVTGRVSAGGNWLGLTGVLTVPFASAAFSIIMDVWPEENTPRGNASFSVPFGTRISVPYSKFAYTMRVQGAPATCVASLTILGGYMGGGFFVPEFAPSAGPTVANVAVTSFGAALTQRTGTPLAVMEMPIAGVLVRTSVGVTDVDSTPLGANAARRAGYICNVGPDPMYVRLEGAAAVAVQDVRIALAARLEFNQAGLVYQGAVHAICSAGQTARFVSIEYT